VFSRIVLVIALVAAALTAGCGGDADTGGVDRTRVVAAFYPLAFLAREVGGGDVEVADLTPPGAEPHDLELTPGDVRDLSNADVVIFAGGGFQPAVERALERREGRTLDVLTGDRLDDAVTDPHVWLDPAAFASVAREVGETLGRPGAGERLADRLQALDAEFAAGLRDCRRRELVTSHAAFGRLARRYGLRQLALRATSPEAEPTARDLARVADAVRRSGATTVFAEPLLPAETVDTIARETGAAVAFLDPLESLDEEACAAGHDYFTIMRRNLDTLRRALGCT
jgi:zinc transport system substrate-binding protein